MRSYIPKRNKLTFLSVTFDIPKRDGHVRIYAYGENTSRIRLPRVNVLGNDYQTVTYVCSSPWHESIMNLMSQWLASLSVGTGNPASPGEEAELVAVLVVLKYVRVENAP